MIVVSAATGAYGSLVVKHLLNRVPAPQIAVAVRNPDKAGPGHPGRSGVVL